MSEDIDAHMLQRMLAEMASTNRMLGNVASGLTGQSSAFDALGESLNRDKQRRENATEAETAKANKWWDDKRSATNGFLSSTAAGLGKVGASSNSFLQDISKLSEGFIILGGIIPAIIKAGSELVEDWQKLSNAGVGFTGGIMEMGKAAAESGVSLSEFTRMSAQNANTISQIGGAAAFGKLALSVRKNSEAFGQFGYTVGQMNDLTGEYMKTLSSSTSLQGINTNAAAVSIKNLAQQTTILSSAYGKSRDEITKISEDAQRSSALIIANAGMSVEEAAKFKDTVGAGITAFAAMPGQAGAFMAKLAADVSAHKENPLASGGPEVDTLVKAGLAGIVPQLADVMERMKAGPEAGEDNFNQTRAIAASLAQQIEQNKNLYKWDKNVSDSMAALYTGLNQAAHANYADAKKSQDQINAMTAALGNYESKWGELSGALRVKLYDFAAQVMDGIMKGWQQFEASGGVKKLSEALNQAGAAIFKFFGSTFTGELATDVATGIQGTLNFVTGAIKVFTEITGFLHDMGASLPELIGAFAILKGVGGIGGLLTALTGPVGLTIAVGLAAAALLKFEADYWRKNHESVDVAAKMAGPENGELAVLNVQQVQRGQLDEAQEKYASIQKEIDALRANQSVDSETKEHQLADLNAKLSDAQNVVDEKKEAMAPARDAYGAAILQGINAFNSMFKSGEENDRDMIAAIKASPRGTTDSVIQLQNMLADSQDQLQAAGNQGNARLIAKIAELHKALTDQTDVLAGLTAQSNNALDAIKASSSTAATNSQ